MTTMIGPLRRATRAAVSCGGALLAYGETLDRCRWPALGASHRPGREASVGGA